MGGWGVEGQVLGAEGRVSMSLTAVTVAFQLLWPGELLQSVTVTIKVSWVRVVWGVEGQLLWPGDLLQSATVTIKVSRAGG